jgi:mannose-1-phosphate guanylyltransferase
MKLIVMAGGQGSKLWPYSTEEKPKQFQPVIGEQSLFQKTVYGLLEGFGVEDIFISTKKKYVKYVLEQTPEIPMRQIIAEPNAKKNQGPGTIYAAMKIADVYPDEPFMVIQSDCIREPNSKLIEMINESDKLVKSTKKLLTGGVRPLYPAMGVDYFQLGEKVKEKTSLEVYTVDKCVYRLGTYKETKALIENFHVVTHTNFQCWFSDLLLEATKELRPGWYEKMIKIRDSFGKANEDQITEQLYSEIENPGNIEEVTFNIFEKNGLVVLLPFKWTDVGTWGSIYEYFTSNGGSSYKDGDIADVDTKGCLIKGKKGKVIATLGIEDLVIVDTDEALLICKKDESGSIKKVLDKMDEKGFKL